MTLMKQERPALTAAGKVKRRMNSFSSFYQYYENLGKEYLLQIDASQSWKIVWRTTYILISTNIIFVFSVKFVQLEYVSTKMNLF